MTKYEEEHQWYTNKELFEQLVDLNKDFESLRGEMKETRILIKQYNGLKEQVEEAKKDTAVLKERVGTIENREQGKSTAWDNIRNWGGWVFGFVTLVILIYNQII